MLAYMPLYNVCIIEGCDRGSDKFLLEWQNKRSHEYGLDMMLS